MDTYLVKALFQGQSAEFHVEAPNKEAAIRKVSDQLNFVAYPIELAVE